MEIIDEYYKIASSAADERQKRIRLGCEFKAEISVEDETKCGYGQPVRFNPEMRCYGVFQFPKDSKNDNEIKPKLVKESKFYAFYTMFLYRCFL